MPWLTSLLRTKAEQDNPPLSDGPTWIPGEEECRSWLSFLLDQKTERDEPSAEGQRSMGELLRQALQWDGEAKEP